MILGSLEPQRLQSVPHKPGGVRVLMNLKVRAISLHFRSSKCSTLSRTGVFAGTSSSLSKTLLPGQLVGVCVGELGSTLRGRVLHTLVFKRSVWMSTRWDCVSSVPTWKQLLCPAQGCTESCSAGQGDAGGLIPITSFQRTAVSLLPQLTWRADSWPPQGRDEAFEFTDGPHLK